MIGTSDKETQRRNELVLAKFQEHGYAALTPEEERIIAFAHNLGGCHACDANPGTVMRPPRNTGSAN